MNNESKTGSFSQGLLWFGAAVSIAEILTGVLIAPLGFTAGLAAILTGHIIGCTLLYFAGLIGAKTGMSAMETVKISFGSKGSLLFSVLNVLQLVGWTAVMIIGGARAMSVVVNPVLGTKGEALWCILIGALILVWILVGLKNLGKLNLFAVGALFILTIVLSTLVFHGKTTAAAGTMTFGSAVELSAAMPISWLPLISDYTRTCKKPKSGTLTSAAFYFFGSCWMYAIGLGAAVFTGSSDIAQIMLKAGLGVAAVLIIILSTVTTTFLDAYSAGVSFTDITHKVSEKWVAVIVAVIGTVVAVFTPIEQYENFLYLIGSVFAPMIAILLTDYFILKKSHIKEMVNITNLILWILGFIGYRIFMQIDTPLGSTFPIMIVITVLCILINGVEKLCLKKSSKM
jgi:putative hydroxymethylpyrimidine transporter CytX